MDQSQDSHLFQTQRVWPCLASLPFPVELSGGELCMGMPGLTPGQTLAFSLLPSCGPPWGTGGLPGGSDGQWGCRGSDFAPPLLPGPWQHQETVLAVTAWGCGGGVLLASIGRESGVLLDMLPCTQQASTAKNALTPNVNSAR